MRASGSRLRLAVARPGHAVPAVSESDLSSLAGPGLGPAGSPGLAAEPDPVAQVVASESA